MTLSLPHHRHTEPLLPLEVAEDRAASERLIELMRAVEDAKALRGRAARDADRLAQKRADAVYAAAVAQLREELKRHDG